MIDISTVPNVAAATTNLIYGALKDDIIPGDGEGTPVRKDWQSDPYYALVAVMNAAGIVADNSPEGATSSQFLTALRKVTKDTMYPVGSFYVQYPDAASNVDATAFPVSARPATMFGGTWVEQFNTEGVVFQTAGYDGAGRTNGLMADQFQGFKVKRVYSNHVISLAPSVYDSSDGFAPGVTSYGTITTTYAGIIGPDGTNGTPRTGTKTSHTNRLAKYWKRTVL